jgi:hypothetical protein
LSKSVRDDGLLSEGDTVERHPRTTRESGLEIELDRGERRAEGGAHNELSAGHEESSHFIERRGRPVEVIVHPNETGARGTRTNEREVQHIGVHQQGAVTRGEPIPEMLQKLQAYIDSNELPSRCAESWCEPTKPDPELEDPGRVETR